MCFEGLCATPGPQTGDAGTYVPPHSLVQNGNFEAGTDGWTAEFGTLTAPLSSGREGSRALSVSVPSGSAHVFPSSASEPKAQPGMTYCVRAHVRGEGTATLGISEQVSGQVLETRTGLVFLSTTAWISILLEREAVSDQTLTLDLALTPPSAGSAILVDDVALWRSPSGLCNEL